MKRIIQTAAIASTMMLVSSVAMADHHEAGMVQQGEAIVKDGGVQSGTNPEVQGSPDASLSDGPIVKDGGTGSDYNAEVAEKPKGDLPDDEMAEGSGVDSASV